ncbi:DsbC family protein [Acinetobacter rathckeae]|uniref:DsbC family protein n=1 Tax=Acinetobacter rathckeae TaxID=2605272 RepID=UPI0018A28B32|nr:DsbC family protein [Acinetobacter rathckeae]MBF7696677.1 DsbC family protein [Acinetobacter rathckeae]
MLRLFLCVISLLCQAVYADVQNLTQQIHLKYPQLHLTQIANTPIQHLYSAQLDGQVVYLDESAEYLFTGAILRLKDQKNITQALSQKSSSLWSMLPLQDAIQIVKGTGQHQIAVFSDPNCPYCQQFERELSRLNNVTVYLFMYPLRTQSVKLTKQVWCSPNASYTWQKLMQQGIYPTATTHCEQPIERNLALGHRLGFDGTPTIIFANGEKNIGLLSATQIQDFWQQHGL